MHFSELEQEHPDFSPRAKDFQPENVPPQRLYLAHLLTSASPLGSNLRAPLASLQLSWQILTPPLPTFGLDFYPRPSVPHRGRGARC